TNACLRATRSRSGANSPRRRLSRRPSFSSSGEGPAGTGAASSFRLMKNLVSTSIQPVSLLGVQARRLNGVPCLAPKRPRPQMFRHRPQHRGGQEQQRPHQKDGSQQDEGEGKGVGPQGPGREGRWLLRGQTPRQGNGGDDRNEATEEHDQSRG